jgi:phosphotriesterase-related protein
MPDDSSGRELVQTVLGPVPAEDLGVTMAHEHLFVDATVNWVLPREPSLRGVAEGAVTMERLGQLRRNPAASRDNCILGDVDTAIAEVNDFRNLGGGTIIDVSNEDIGRDAAALAYVSRATGIHVVAGCGHYIHRAHPAGLEREPVESVAERLIGEITDGIGKTGVRAGIIGEIGTSEPLHPREVKVLRAAAQAQREIGAAITLHVTNMNGHDVLDVLEEAGADLAHVVVGHQDSLLAQGDLRLEGIVEHLVSLAARGSYVQFDTVGKEYSFPALADYSRTFWFPSDRVRAQVLKELVDAGIGHSLLLSQDVCSKVDLLRYGGFGYGHVLRTFVGDIAELGVAAEDVRRMLVDNPRRMLVRSTTGSV